MPDAEYHRLDIALSQLELAIELFVSERSYFAAISLAGAADAILIGFVAKAGKHHFGHDMQEEVQQTQGVTPPVGKILSKMNDVLHINVTKHYDQNDPETVSLDPERGALGAILKAIVNVKKLISPEPSFVKAMMLWAYANLNEDGTFRTPEDRAARAQTHGILRAHSGTSRDIRISTLAARNTPPKTGEP